LRLDFILYLLLVFIKTLFILDIQSFFLPRIHRHLLFPQQIYIVLLICPVLMQDVIRIIQYIRL
jgi:hypothetical protein